MKKLICTLALIATTAMSTSCHESKEINGKIYEPVGLLEDKESCIIYKPVVGNIIWACILIETVVAPLIIFGYYLFEPVNIKHECEKGNTK